MDKHRTTASKWTRNYNNNKKKMKKKKKNLRRRRMWEEEDDDDEDDDGRRRRRIWLRVMPSILSGITLLNVVRICENLYISPSHILDSVTTFIIYLLIKEPVWSKLNLCLFNQRTALFRLISLDWSEIKVKRTDDAKHHSCSVNALDSLLSLAWLDMN